MNGDLGQIGSWLPTSWRHFLARDWRLAAILLLVTAAVAQTIWLPVNPDEVASRIALERFFLNGGYKQSVWAVCSNFLVRPPASLIAASAGWALFDQLGIGFWSYRLMPMACIVMIVAALLRLKSNDRPLLFFLVVALGPTIYGVAIMRAEIAMLATYVGLFFSLTALLAARPVWSRLAWLCLVVFGFSFTALAHPKALYLFPLVLICIVAGARGFRSLPARILAGGVFAGTASLIAVQAAAMFLFLLSSCNQVPALAVYYQHQAVNIFDAIGDRARFFEDLSSAFRYEQLARLIRQVTYRGTYDLNFLPPVELGGWEKFANALIVSVIVATLLYAAARIVCGLLSRKTFEDRIRYLFLGMSLGIACFTLATNLNKNFYDCSLFVCSVACIAALAETLPINVPAFFGLRTGGFAALATAILLGALLSVCLNLRDFTLKFASGHIGSSVINFRAQPPLAVELDDALKRHSVPGNESIVVDDQTYGILRRHPATLPITYLLVDHGALLSAATKKHGAAYGAFSCSYIDELSGVADVQILERVDPRTGVIPTCLVSFKQAWAR